jgi:carbamoyl-phosphate synthase large subunit
MTGVDPHVLVTGAGGPSGVSVMRALGSVPSAILAADIDPYAPGLYLAAPEDRLIIPRGDDPRFVDAILALCRNHAVDVVVPTVDSELVPLARRRGEFTELGVELVLASLDTLEVCVDKWRLAERCRGVVPAPWTLLLDEELELDAVELPAIVKPRTGSGSRGIRIVATIEELRGCPRDGTLLVQELLPGIEHSIDVLADPEGRIVAVVPRSRLKVDSGIAITGRTHHDERLEAIGEQVARLIGLSYCGNVQVKEDVHGEPALLEVNPRFPGTMPLTVASGVNMPLLAVCAAAGEAMPQGRIPFREIGMARHHEELFVAVEEIASLEQQALAVHTSAVPVA